MIVYFPKIKNPFARSCKHSGIKNRLNDEAVLGIGFEVFIKKELIAVSPSFFIDRDAYTTKEVFTRKGTVKEENVGRNKSLIARAIQSDEMVADAWKFRFARPMFAMCHMLNGYSLTCDLMVAMKTGQTPVRQALEEYIQDVREGRIQII